jgi:hypothetical protein
MLVEKEQINMKNKILLLAKNGYIFSKQLKEQNIPSVYIRNEEQDTTNTL